MKLETAVKIEKVIDVITIILSFPFGLCRVLFNTIGNVFEYVQDRIMYLGFYICNYLLRISQEVKDGVIKNEWYVEHSTPSNAYKKLKEEIGV